MATRRSTANTGPTAMRPSSEALQDCQALLCRGMGGRAATELQANGIRPVVFVDDLSPEEAVAGLLAGTLKAASTFCRCHE